MDLSDDELRRRLRDGVSRFGQRGQLDAEAWDEFAKRIFYQQGDFKKPETYSNLVEHLAKLEKEWNIKAQRIFANPLFEPLWNRRYVEHIAITVAEDVGIEHRGGYYDQAGALRDMAQNHLMQLLCLVAMEPMVSFDPDEIRNKKVDVLHAVRPIHHDAVAQCLVRGQYGNGWIGGQAVGGYREEEGVSPDSQTVTFVALKLYIDIKVNPDLSVPGHPDVFAIGDTAAITCYTRSLFGIRSKTPEWLPGVARVAIQGGAYVARLIRRRVNGEHSAKPFWYWDKGNMAIVGRTFAVADLKHVCFSGFTAWLLWAGVHIYFLIGFANRLLVTAQRGISFVTKRRGVRILPLAQAEISHADPGRQTSSSDIA